ncbi:MAG TPA: CYTH domain-containing protein [Candidatus Deferrimicrobium sp.]|nr:CYTH domain-containing protein [Candidatus Deferrimicrobium sp.]
MTFREYEAMVLVENEELLLKKFQDLGATLLKRVLQRDTYYDIQYNLTKKDELLRLRIEETIDTHEFVAAEFSWKSGRTGENYEVRDDISISLPSKVAVENLEIILIRLGFRKLAYLIKYRDRWRNKNNIDFEFDKYIEAQAINRPKKQIGSYLQATIETTHDFQTSIEQLLWTALEQLGFNRTQFLRESYIELYLQQLNELDSFYRFKNETFKK